MKGEYYKTKESVDEYIKLAEGINGSELIKKLNQTLPLNSNILELGSGPGTDWEILNQFHTVTGSDNSSEFLNHLTTKYPHDEFLNLDAVSINTDKQFDCIYSNKVLHHLNDVELKDSIKRQSEILKVNGVISHSFWKGKDFEIFKGLHVNYHEEEDLKIIFEKYFEIISITKYQEFDEGDSILLVGKKR